MRPSPPVDAAGIALAAHDLRVLIRCAPERLLWSPGRPIWGMALIRGSDRAIIAIDGCLTIAMTLWPTHYRAGARYPLDSMVRVLAQTMGIKRFDGSSLFTCSLPHAVSGSCCVIVTQAELPWLAPDLPVLPLTDHVEWQAPEQPPATSSLVALHPWMSLAGLRPGCASAAEFFATVGEPPDLPYLPPVARLERLRSYWRLHLLHERARLRVAEQALPRWMDDDAALVTCAGAWIAGWRGPQDPPDAQQLTTASTVVPSATTIQTAAPAADPGVAGAPVIGDACAAPAADDASSASGGGMPWA